LEEEIVMADDQIEVMLTEYKSLRDEIKRNFDLQIKLYGIFVSGLGVVYGLIFKFGVSDLVLLIPFIFLPLGLRVQHSNYGVKIIGEYLKDKLEPQIKIFMKEKKVEWEGWQTFWEKRNLQKVIDSYDTLAKALLFIVIPMGIAILYLLSIILKLICINITVIPSIFHIPLIIVYVGIISFVLVYVKIFLNRWDDEKRDWLRELEKLIGVGKTKLIFKEGFDTPRKVKKEKDIEKLKKIKELTEGEVKKIIEIRDKII